MHDDPRENRHAPPPPKPRTTRPEPHDEHVAHEETVLTRLAELTAELNDPWRAAASLFTATETTEPAPAARPARPLGTKKTKKRRRRRSEAARRPRTAAAATE